MDHWSDCAIYDETGDLKAECSCGGVDLTDDLFKSARVVFIPSTGRFGFFVDHMNGEGFIDEESFPTDALIRIASSANLINAHRFMVGGIDPDCVNLDDARPTIIAKLKAFALSQGVAENSEPHHHTSNHG